MARRRKIKPLVWITLAGILLFYNPGQVGALPMGPIQPANESLSASLILSVDSRELRPNNWKLERALYLGELGYGLNDRLEVFARAGFMDPDVNEYNVEKGWGGGLGIRGIVWEASDWQIKAFGEYFWSREHDLERNHQRVSTLNIDEYQLGLTWQVQIEEYPFSPYIGARYSEVELTGGAFPQQKGDRNAGFVLGFDLPLQDEKLLLNLEGHLVDEEGASLNLKYIF